MPIIVAQGEEIRDFAVAKTAHWQSTGGDGTSLLRYKIAAPPTRLPDQHQHPSQLSPHGRKSAATSLAPVEVERNTRSVPAHDPK